MYSCKWACISRMYEYFSSTDFVNHNLKTNKRKYKKKEFFWKSFKEILKIGLVALIALALCVIIVKKCGNTFGEVKTSFFIINNSRLLTRVFNKVLYTVDDLLVNCISMFPKYSIFICIIITIICLMIISKKKWSNIIYYLIITTFAILCTVIPLFFINVGTCSRTSIPIMMIFGISLLTLISSIKEDDKRYKNNIICTITIVLFVINSIYIIRNTTEHIAANQIDHNEGAQIKRIVENYEKETGIEIKYLSYTYDSNPQQFATGIKPMQSLTERKLACSWSIKHAMNYYCNKKFEVILFNLFEKINKDSDYIESIKYQEIIQKDYTEFSEEQIIIKGDTLYMIVY